MGVSGSGKTSIGQLLAQELSFPFVEGDDYHPITNIEKMSQGLPLNDSDREPWLDKLHHIAVDHLNSGCVISCSALKEAYRRRLAYSIETKVSWVYLKGNYDQVFDRINKRKGHFMKSGMLRSQFEVLEEPKNAIEVNIAATPKTIIQEIKQRLE